MNLFLRKKNIWSADNLWKEVQNGAWDVSMQWMDSDKDEELTLGGMDWSLADLLGEQQGASFSLRPLQISAEDDAAVSVLCSFKAGALAVPVQLEVKIGSNTLRLCLELKFDPTTFRLSTNRLDIRLPLGGNCDRLSIIDLEAFAFFLPHRFANGYFDSIDGSFDFEKRELVQMTLKKDSDEELRIEVLSGYLALYSPVMDTLLPTRLLPDPSAPPNIKRLTESLGETRLIFAPVSSDGNKDEKTPSIKIKKDADDFLMTCTNKAVVTYAPYVSAAGIHFVSAGAPNLLQYIDKETSRPVVEGDTTHTLTPFEIIDCKLTASNPV